jgi:hypothetical protein
MPVIVKKFGGGRTETSLEFATLKDAAGYLNTTPGTVRAWARREGGLAPGTGLMKTAVILTGRHAEQTSATRKRRASVTATAQAENTPPFNIWLAVAIAQALVIGVLLAYTGGAPC